jgi:hypothetical protein
MGGQQPVVKLGFGQCPPQPGRKCRDASHIERKQKQIFSCQQSDVRLKVDVGSPHSPVLHADSDAPLTTTTARTQLAAARRNRISCFRCNCTVDLLDMARLRALMHVLGIIDLSRN